MRSRLVRTPRSRRAFGHKPLQFPAAMKKAVHWCTAFFEVDACGLRRSEAKANLHTNAGQVVVLEITIDGWFCFGVTKPGISHAG